MIRLVALIIMGVVFYLLYRANADNLVSVHWVDRSSRPVPLAFLLLYTFLAGAMGYALFTLPERFKSWRTLRKNKRSLRKMGRSLNNVISNAKSPHR